MKVIKPMKLGLLTRCIEFKRRFRMGICVLMQVPLGEQKDLYSEVSLWKFAAGELGKDAVLDAGIPKLVPEFLVHGRAFAPGAKPVPACAVRARFGAREKSLFVFGDRYWDGDTATPAEPFAEMPLDWARAFGGADHPANPLGKGTVQVARPDGRRLLPLPNIEHPEQRILRPQDRPAPAGFGPIDQTWPQRAARVGTYDDAWLKNDFPGMARDIDWRFFNLAAADQWLDFPVAEDASYEFENLHPTRPVVSGRLPAFVARCFVGRGPDDHPTLEKVAMRLGTAWFFPAAERAILIYQGFVDIAEEDGADIRHLMIAAEHSAEPKPSTHYLEVLKSRLDKARGALNQLREADLLPGGLAGADPDLEKVQRMLTSEGRLRRNLAKLAEREIVATRAIVAGHGLDPDEHAPALPQAEEHPPSLEQLPDFMEKMIAAGEKQRREAEENSRRVIEETAAQFAALGLDFEYVRKEIAERVKGPPTFSAQAQLDSLETLAKQLADDPVAVAELEGYSKDPAFRDRLMRGERKMREVYVATAHMQDPALPMAAERAEAVHSKITAALARGQSFANLDLTGAKLSNLDLSGADFSGAFLECADFEGTRLERCNFAGAVLTRTRLHGANLSSANLSGANLGGVDCTDTRFDNATLSKAILHGAKLVRSSFKGARLDEANCSQAHFDDVDWSDTQLGAITFMDTTLTGLRLAGAQLAGANFLRCDVSGVDFHGATLDGAVFLAATGVGANFAGASLNNLRCVEACDFSQADFTDARLVEANLRGCKLQGAHFIRARLDKSDLSEADLREAWFYQASAMEARMVKADLSDAILVSTNLMNAVLQRSNILRADFRLANLFQADFARVRVDRSVKFDRALRTRMRTVPRLVEPTP
ncbi:MAG: DUF2169 family type VI secretion system accessory protein [Panacagrimonas sp.]